RVARRGGLKVSGEDAPPAGGGVRGRATGPGAAEAPPGQEGLPPPVDPPPSRPRRSGQPSLSSRLALNGIGEWNAFTSMDTTAYYQVGAPETLPRMVEVEVGRMLDPLQGVEGQYFDGERGVMLNELHFPAESGLYQEVHRQLFQQLFATGHPYARGVGGTEESLARLTLDQARAFVQTHYRPKQMTWVLSGALDRTQVAALLERSVPPELRE